MLFNVGCTNNSSSDESGQIEFMDVGNLWQGSVPVEYENMVTACQSAKPNLLIPYAISENGLLQVDLYACWVGTDLTSCTDAKSFEKAQVDTDGNKVTVSLRQSDWPQDICPLQAAEFVRYHTIEINEPWQRGELQIVVETSGDDLTGFITVE